MLCMRVYFSLLFLNNYQDITSHHKGGFDTNLVKNCKLDAFRKIMELIMLCMRVCFSLFFFNNYQDITSHHKGGFSTLIKSKTANWMRLER